MNIFYINGGNFMKTLLLGDLCPTEKTASLFQKKDMETLFTDTLELFENNDINFINLECAITESDAEISKIGPALKAPKETADVLKNLGVNCVGVSNNHFFDFGIKGVNDSVKALNEAGIPFTGFGENYENSRNNFIVKKNGERICIIAVCGREYSYALENRMGCRPFDEYDTLEDVRKAKENCDRVIVIYHGGNEYCKYPSPGMHRMCHALARSGADVIIGQHSHCIGCYENYNGCHIIYGQGNFHFIKEMGISGNNIDISKTWNECLAVKYDTKTNKIEFIPIVAYDYKGIMLAKDEKKAQILDLFERRNKQLENGEWKQGWHDFCMAVEPFYTDVVKNVYTKEPAFVQREMFAHYLDCDAHTEVWREMFKTFNYTNEV